MGWICAQTETNMERMARRHLQAAGYSEIYLPEIREQRRQRGKTYNVVVPLFARYLFIHLLDGRWWQARRTIGIVDILMSADGTPARVPDREIESLRSRERNGLIVLPKRAEFEPGDRVQVTSGALFGQFGLVESMRGPDRIFVLMQLLGSERPVQLMRQHVRRVE
jgi:transcriptional antiterminator RfaH